MYFSLRISWYIWHHITYVLRITCLQVDAGSHWLELAGWRCLWPMTRPRRHSAVWRASVRAMKAVGRFPIQHPLQENIGDIRMFSTSLQFQMKNLGHVPSPTPRQLEKCVLKRVPSPHPPPTKSTSKEKWQYPFQWWQGKPRLCEGVHSAFPWTSAAWAQTRCKNRWKWSLTTDLQRAPSFDQDPPVCKKRQTCKRSHDLYTTIQQSNKSKKNGRLLRAVPIWSAPKYLEQLQLP